MLPCTHHPDLPTAEACDQCGRPFCANCLLEISGKRVCGACRDAAVAQAVRRGGEDLRCKECGAGYERFVQHCPRCGRPTGEPQASGLQLTPANHFAVAVIVVAAVFAIAYRWIRGAGLSETYALFVGLPLLVGVTTAYLVPARQGLGSVMKITTILLCAVAPLLGEGTICLIMAAPLFYGVAALGWVIVAAVSGRLGRRPKGLWCLVALPFLWADWTSTPNRIANPKTLVVTTRRFVRATPERAWSVLLGPGLVPERFPLFLRLGFPLPTRLERRAGGVTRLQFTPRRGHHPGEDLIESLQRVDASRRRLTFLIHDDTTLLGRWMRFRQTELWVEPAPGGCYVSHRTTFQQRLQPGCYWNPLQEFALGQTHDAALARIAALAERPEQRP